MFLPSPERPIHLVVLASTTQAEAMCCAEALRSAIAGTPVPLADGVLHMTASIVVALHQAGDQAGDADILLHEADVAMYAAKTGGRNRVVYATPAKP